MMMPTPPGAGQAPGLRCHGCGALFLHEGAQVVTAPGHSALACAACCERAQTSPQFRMQFQLAVMAGVPLFEVQRVFASIGVRDVPVTPAGCMQAVGWTWGHIKSAPGTH